MVAYNSTKAVNNVQPKFLPKNDITVIGSFAYSTAPSTDTITFMTIPGSVASPATIVDIILDSDQLETGTNMRLRVGDTGSTARFIQDVTICNVSSAGAASPVHASVRGVIGFQYTTNTAILVTVNTAPGTALTTGSIRLAVTYTMDP